MADLAYFVATGRREFRVAVNLAIRSLRRFGRFRGEIVVFADRPFPLPRGVRLELLTAEEQRRPSLKMAAGRRLDLERHRTVLYADCDLLFRSSMEPFLERCAATGKLICTDDMGLKAGEEWFCKSLSAEERARFAGAPGINSGFFCAPGGRLREILARWEAETLRSLDLPGYGIDQPPLNALVLREEIEAEVPTGLMWFPFNHDNSPERTGGEREVYLRARRTAPLVHFTGLTLFPEQLGRMLVRYLVTSLRHPFGMQAAVRGAPPVAGERVGDEQVSDDFPAEAAAAEARGRAAHRRAVALDEAGDAGAPDGITQVSGSGQ